MKRYIGIDNVCAWPNLTLLPNGSIVAMIFNQPGHGLWEGDVDCWISEDGGAFWRYTGKPAPHESGTNRMNVAAGLATNGDLLVLSSGWSHRPRQGQEPRDHKPPARTLSPWICRSTNGGRTWTQTDMLLNTSNSPDHVSMIPFGDIVQLADGALGACIYGRTAEGAHLCNFYTSKDQGRTWSLRGMVQADNINETAPVVLPNGEVLACARTVDDQHLELFRSLDNGRTWQREQVVSQAMQHPAHLLNMADGRVLLTYGNRREGEAGIMVRISADAGHTWSEATHLVHLDQADLGYPATVQQADGTLVTAWYASGVAAHQRYHMGVAVWAVADLDV